MSSSSKKSHAASLQVQNDPQSASHKAPLVRVSSVALALSTTPQILHAGQPASSDFDRKRRQRSRREGRALKKRSDRNGIPVVPQWAILDEDAPALPQSGSFCKQIDIEEFEAQAARSAQIVAALIDEAGVQAPPLPEEDPKLVAAQASDVAAMQRELADADKVLVDADKVLLTPAADKTAELNALTLRRRNPAVVKQTEAVKQSLVASSPAKVPTYMAFVQRAKKSADHRRQSTMPTPVVQDDEDMQQDDTQDENKPTPAVEAAIHGQSPLPASRHGGLRRTLAESGLQMSAIQAGAFGGHKYAGTPTASPPASPRTRASRLKALLSPRKTPQRTPQPLDGQQLSPTNQALDLATTTSPRRASRPRRLSHLFQRGISTMRQAIPLPSNASDRQDTAMTLCQPREMSARVHMKKAGVAAIHELLLTQRVFCEDIERVCEMRVEMFDSFVHDGEGALEAEEVDRVFGRCNAVRDVHKRVLGALENACAPLRAWLSEHVDVHDPQQPIAFSKAALDRLEAVGEQLRVAPIFEALADELERVHRIDGMSANLQQPGAKAIAQKNELVARYMCFNTEARNGAGEFEVKPGLGQHFQAILTAPTVRLMRLPLLFVEISKFTDPDHPEFVARQRITQRLKDVGQHVNDASRIAEQERAAHAALDRFVVTPSVENSVAGDLVRYWRDRRAQAMRDHDRLLRGDVAISEMRDPRLLAEFSCQLCEDGSTKLMPARVFVFSERVVVALPCNARAQPREEGADACWLPVHVCEINVLFMRLHECVAWATKQAALTGDTVVLGGSQLDVAWREVTTHVDANGQRKKEPWPSAVVELAYPANIALGGLPAAGDAARQANAFARIELHLVNASAAFKCAQVMRQATLSMLVRPGTSQRLASRNQSRVLCKRDEDGQVQVELLPPAPHYAKAEETAAASTDDAATGETEAQKRTRLALEALAQDPAFLKWQASKQEADDKKAKRKRRTAKFRQILTGTPAAAAEATPVASPRPNKVAPSPALRAMTPNSPAQTASPKKRVKIATPLHPVGASPLHTAGKRSAASQIVSPPRRRTSRR